jgi:hypothetical protein
LPGVLDNSTKQFRPEDEDEDDSEDEESDEDDESSSDEDDETEKGPVTIPVAR